MKSENIFKNLIWRFMERFFAQAVSFIVSIVLARLLSPDDYGTIALVNVFITILDVFVNCGMGSALIQKKNADDTDFSTVFFFNIIWCLLIYFILFLFAPLIAQFYKNDDFIILTRVMGLVIIISGVKNILQAYIAKNMQFKKFFYATLIGTIFSAVIGIAMAYYGFGAWALVIQNLVNITVDTIILWIVIQWRPQLLFSISRLKTLFNFGWKMFVSTLLETLYNNLTTLLIGKFYSTSDLAFYTKGQKWPQLIISNINTSIDSVLLPALSAEQDDRFRIKVMMRKSIQISSYVVWPMLIGLIAISEPLVNLVLTEKWLPSVPYLQLACITYAFWPLYTANLNAIQAIGRSDVFLKLEILKKILGVLTLILTLPISVKAMAIGNVVTIPIYILINSLPNIKFLNYGIKEQIKDLFPSVFISFLMFIIIKLFGLLPIFDLVLIIGQIGLGIIAYCTFSIIFKSASFYYLLNLLKRVINRKK